MTLSWSSSSFKNRSWAAGGRGSPHCTSGSLGSLVPYVGPQRVKGSGQAHLSSTYFTHWVSSFLEGLLVVRTLGLLDPKISGSFRAQAPVLPILAAGHRRQARGLWADWGTQGRCCGAIQQLRGEPMRGQVGQDPKPCTAQWVIERASRGACRGTLSEGDRSEEETVTERKLLRLMLPKKSRTGLSRGRRPVTSAAQQRPDRTCSRALTSHSSEGRMTERCPSAFLQLGASRRSWVT